MEAQGLEERGLFWWAGVTIPAGSYAPDSAIPGTLKVAQNGQTILELDRFLPREQGPPAARSNNFSACALVGILKQSGSYVRLEDLEPGGFRISDHLPSFESFRAFTCFRSDKPVRGERHLRCCTSIEIGLDGFEPWLDLENRPIRQSRIGMTFRWTRRRKRSYDLTSGRMTVTHELTHDSDDQQSTITLRQSGKLTYKPRIKMSLDDAKDIVRRLEDLLVLLTDIEKDLVWPQIKVTSMARSGTLYFARMTRSQSSKPAAPWTTFPQLSDQFGRITDAWLVKHEKLGPAFHLYLGNRRGISLYLEHRFMSLIWGLESLHRQLRAVEPNPRLRTKVDRILAGVSEKKDRDWLKGYLRHADEPSLAVRLYEILADLPLGLDPRALRAFAEECANKRHDISHFGGLRAPGGYRTLLRDLQHLLAALDPLYHFRILREVGVPDDLIRFAYSRGVAQFFISEALKAPRRQAAMTTNSDPPAL